LPCAPPLPFLMYLLHELLPCRLQKLAKKDVLVKGIHVHALAPYPRSRWKLPFSSTARSPLREHVSRGFTCRAGRSWPHLLV
jgi:hypothetical protein